MGGNGSEKGCQDLTRGGVKTIFIPGTIDNDVDDSEYSIGFDTAVDQCCQTINNLMPCMKTMENSCVVEVMGRHCSLIADAVAERAKADFCIKEKSDTKYRTIAAEIKRKRKIGQSTLIVLRENIVSITDFAQKLNDIVGDSCVKKQIVGYTQRGGKPTKVELETASKFATVAIKAICQKSDSQKILMQKGKVVAVKSTALETKD